MEPPKKKQRSDSIVFEGYEYATLDFTSPFEKATIGTHGQFINVPHPWVLAPNEPGIVNHVVATYTWGTNVLVVADGMAFWTENGNSISQTPGKQS